MNCWILNTSVFRSHSLFFFICFVTTFSYILHFCNTSLADDTIRKISVNFENSDLPSAVATILTLGHSGTNVLIDGGIAKTINKKAENVRWDHLLQEILQENGLKLEKRKSEYWIVERRETRENPTSNIINLDQTTHFVSNTDAALLNLDCTANDLVTLGYQYGSGLNPYALNGKCVKLHNIVPIQYLSETEALAQWTYRGNQGIVYIEDLSNNHLITNSRVLLTKANGVYEYVNTLGAKQIIPKLLVK
jgi:hypothetical protein